MNNFKAIFQSRDPKQVCAHQATPDKSAASISFGHWCTQVKALSSALTMRNEQQWALFTDDALSFSIGLFALIDASKDVYLPGNNTPETANRLGDHCQAFLGHWDTSASAIDTEHYLPLNAADVQSTSYKTQEQTSCSPAPSSQARIIVFTSGSSGEPKAIEKQLWQFEQEISAFSTTLKKNGVAWPASVEILGTVSHQHIYGMIFRVLMPLYQGNVFHSQQYLDAGQILKYAIDQSKPVLWIASPAHLKRLPDQLPWQQARQHLVDITSSGGPFSTEAASLLNDNAGASALEIFGSSETGGVAIRRQFSQLQYWQAFDDVIVSAAEDKRLVLASEHLQESRYLMDDAVKFLPDGSFELLGRTDRIVKLEEKRLSLVELESTMNNQLWVKENSCRVINSASRDLLCAVVVLNDQGKALITTLPKREIVKGIKDFLQQYFELSLLPRKWRFVDTLPVNSQGKIDTTEFETLFVETDTQPRIQ
ncbi:Gramicidin S synthase 2 [BD1-7 clade bacterium]|uniref:Gramicidin S synthase 2 n=1 Tax=BD1-7 clade bacterium TaxID=2029982 RepID=A0A5S9QJS4_9GAMM|nr:Gramicidin S synthase 2 [BD1-7 clade bacterium]CAA0119127.1 Gramicidin S synthase 2 [BD1-7 clade bacterium]